MPHVDLLFPRVRRLAAVLTLAAALTFVASAAFAADEPPTASGGTTAAPPPAKPKKVSTKAIQKALGMKADGVMGPRTKRALKRFQKAHGLEADGVAGPETLEALGLVSAPSDRSLDAASLDPATVLAKIAECESGGDITAVSADGRYHGKYQFSIATWERLGGTGKPEEAPENVQDTYAAALYAEQGLKPWPACSEQITASAS